MSEANSWEILSALEDKIRIPARPCNILYLFNELRCLDLIPTLDPSMFTFLFTVCYSWPHILTRTVVNGSTAFVFGVGSSRTYLTAGHLFSILVGIKRTFPTRTNIIACRVGSCQAYSYNTIKKSIFINSWQNRLYSKIGRTIEIPGNFRTLTVRAGFGSSNGCRVVLWAWLAFWFPFLVLIEPNVSVLTRVSQAVAVRSRRTIY